MQSITEQPDSLQIVLMTTTGLMPEEHHEAPGSSDGGYSCSRALHSVHLASAAIVLAFISNPASAGAEETSSTAKS